MGKKRSANYRPRNPNPAKRKSINASPEWFEKVILDLGTFQERFRGIADEMRQKRMESIEMRNITTLENAFQNLAKVVVAGGAGVKAKESAVELMKSIVEAKREDKKKE